MIKVKLDFKNIRTERELIMYLNKKLALATKDYTYPNSDPNWDAFADNFGDIVYKEIDLDTLTEEEKENNGLEIIKSMNELGLKNKDGVRDDLEITLINFNELKQRNSQLANDFLHFTQDNYEEMAKMEDEDEIVKVAIIIQS
jgi:hypothetical protein